MESNVVAWCRMLNPSYDNVQSILKLRFLRQIAKISPMNICKCIYIWPNKVLIAPFRQSIVLL